MALSEQKMREYVKRLLLSRMRILCNNGFYGLLLMHMIYAMDENCETAATDGVRIYFGPDFLERLSDGELDFVMMHEIMHVVLQHCLRQGDRDNERFNIACDIVVNSNILLSNDMNLSTITLKDFGEAMHLAPNGKEGHNYTAEEVYEMLPKTGGLPDGGNADGDGQSGGGKGQGNSVPNGKKGNNAPDNNGNNAPNGNKDKGGSSSASANGKGGSAQKGNGRSGGKEVLDDHSRWGTYADDETLRDTWVKRFEDACEAMEIREASTGRGTLPAFAKRILQELRKSQIDWRTILNDFIQEEVVDYSFTPPDRRYDGPFFLPDFNDKDDVVENVLFMIDTSGSMSDAMITAAYSEVKGAIDQFDGKLKGWLGFFDAAIIEPTPFENEDEFEIIKPVGGGGTSFDIIFKYVKDFMQDKLPASIIILTDGYAPFPEEEAALGIPVLWLLNNQDVDPPWGKVARITVDEKQ